jgi:hypothetical protein
LSIRLTQFYNKAKDAEIVDLIKKIDVSLLENIEANTNGAPLSIKKNNNDTSIGATILVNSKEMAEHFIRQVS